MSGSSYVGRGFSNVADTQNDYHQKDYQKDYHQPEFNFDSRDDARSVSSKSSTRSRVKKSSEYGDKTFGDKTIGIKTFGEKTVQKPRTDENDDEEEAFYDYRYVWATGFFLLVITFVYFYWQNTYECCVFENDVTNMTMQYAIDQFSSTNELKENLDIPKEVQPEIVNS